MSAATEFKGLITARFFLGLFEATVGELIDYVLSIWGVYAFHCQLRPL